MPVFPTLADPHTYTACEVDLLCDHDARAYWIDLFRTHIDVNLAAARQTGVSAESCDAAREDLHALLDRVTQTPDLHGRLDILKLDELRQVVLSRHGIENEFRLIKQRENEASLAELPDYLEWLDGLADDDRIPAIIEGMLAGNFFDMGVKATSADYSDGGVTFAKARERVPHRPWLFDDLDRAVAALRERPPKQVVIFADNAGADCVLGVLPLARELRRRGADVVITANNRPVLNDITAEEFDELRRRAAVGDPALRDPRITILPSGNIQPLIDLTSIGQPLADASTDTDLVILVGMGRALESNFSARFHAMAWKIAMVKDPQVARNIEGELYDAVFRFDDAIERA